MVRLSRRAFIHAALLAGAASTDVLRALAEDGTSPPEQAVTNWDGSPLGRILLNVMTEYKEPSWRADPSGTFYYWNNVVPISGALVGEGLYSTNHTWLQTATGYIYSSWVQPVNDIPTNPTLPIAEGGAWGMVTVPVADVRTGPSDDSSRRQSPSTATSIASSLLKTITIR
jgi:hypothetical protein